MEFDVYTDQQLANKCEAVSYSTLVSRAAPRKQKHELLRLGCARAIARAGPRSARPLTQHRVTDEAPAALASDVGQPNPAEEVTDLWSLRQCL